MKAIGKKHKKDASKPSQQETSSSSDTSGTEEEPEDKNCTPDPTNNQ